MIPHFADEPAALNDRPRAGITDEDIMALIQARSADGLKLLHDRYARLLRGMSVKVLHNDADADDLLQEVFLEIWDRAATYDPLKGRALAWIVTLARRRSIDRLRRRAVYLRVEARLTQELKTITSRWTHVYEDVALHDMSKYLNRALRRLPAAQRQAIKLAYHGHMTQREIAAHMGIPLGTIKTRLELGLRKMSVFLQGREDLIGAPARFRLEDYKERSTIKRLTKGRPTGGGRQVGRDRGEPRVIKQCG